MRKCWTVKDGKVSRGIRLAETPVPTINVGNGKWDRISACVSVPPEGVIEGRRERCPNWESPASNIPCEKCGMEYGYHKNFEPGILTGLPDYLGEVTVVLIKDHSGAKSMWALHGALTPEESLRVHLSRKEHKILFEKDRCFGEALKTGGHTTMTGAPAFWVGDCTACRRPKRPPAVTIIAKDSRDVKAAGTRGGNAEYLLGFRAGQAIEIRRWGRLYGEPEIFRVEANANGEIRVINVEAEAASMDAALKL